MKSILYQAIEYQKKGPMAVIKINAPAKDQVELPRLHDELAGLYDEIVWDEEIKVIILTGIGEKYFSMGASLKETISRVQGEQQIRIFSITELIAKLDRPVIAGVKGDAFGQGLELALACDIRIATETSRFGLPHIVSGLIPWDGGTQRLSRVVGRGKAMEMILTGEVINAQEAHRIGLVHRVVPEDELVTEAMDMAREISTKSPIALRYAKEAINKGMDVTLEQGLRLEADLYFLLHTTRDRTEGIRAFREKRPPRFKGE